MTNAKTVASVNGPVITVDNAGDLSMMDMVYVGRQRLIGEVISLEGGRATVQVYEETGGLGIGEPVESTGGPMCVTLGPGILHNIFDGIQRPLEAIREQNGLYIHRGVQVPSLDTEKKWTVTVTAKVGDTLSPGQIYATCPGDCGDHPPLSGAAGCQRPGHFCGS